jgi:hypothetical protein
VQGDCTALETILVRATKTDRSCETIDPEMADSMIYSEVSRIVDERGLSAIEAIYMQCKFMLNLRTIPGWVSPTVLSFKNNNNSE